MRRNACSSSAVMSFQRQAAGSGQEGLLYALDPARGIAWAPAAVVGGVQFASNGSEVDARHCLAGQLVKLAFLSGAVPVRSTLRASSRLSQPSFSETDTFFD